MMNSYVGPDEKTYFQPGDIVMLKQEIPNKPTMVVVKIERSIIKNGEQSPYLRGVKTRWFTTQGQIQEAIFSTKDLIKI